MSISAPRCVVAAALSLALSVFAATISAGLVALPAVTSAPIPVQLGYDDSELFCGPVGEVQYVAIKRQVELKLILTPIRANRQYLVDWRNNNVRGYTIGVFSTDRVGAIRKGSVRMFRPGEVRGVGVDVYYLVGNTPSGLMRLTPCGPK